MTNPSGATGVPARPRFGFLQPSFEFLVVLTFLRLRLPGQLENHHAPCLRGGRRKQERPRFPMLIGRNIRPHTEKVNPLTW